MRHVLQQNAHAENPVYGTSPFICRITKKAFSLNRTLCRSFAYHGGSGLPLPQVLSSNHE